MKFILNKDTRQICLIAENVILEGDIYYTWNDDAPHKITRSHSFTPFVVVEAEEGTVLPEDKFIIGKYCYTVEGTFEVWENWIDKDLDL